MSLRSRIWWPRTLVAQLIVVTAAAVLLSSIAVAAWFTASHERMTESALMERLLDRAASAATLLAGIPHREREAAARTMSSGPWHFRLKYGKPVQGEMSGEEAALAARVRALLPEKRQREPVTVRLLKLREHPEIHPPPHRRPIADVVEITLPVVRGTELVTRFFLPQPGPWPRPFLLATAFTVITASTAAAFAARRVARPLSKLTAAASEVARGGEAPHVPEQGPDDIRRAAVAFNAMTDQVKRTLESQRQLLSAVGHDLRTPITAMRISTEFIEDTEVKERIEKNLEELQTLTEAVLSAARGAGWEQRRRIDIAALVDSVCADLEEIDKPVTWENHAAVPASCRPNEIRRAVRNLVENAIAYGKTAHVSLQEEDGTIAIRIDDEGPGISDEDHAKVFEPFVRLEGSRSAETGGAGLGLTLVKTIAEGHGGSVTLENRPEGGLRAILRLPREGGAA